jgi:predicted MFS family arabinose efflux permease
MLVSAPSVPGTAPTPLRDRLAPLRSLPVLRLVAVTFLAASGGLMFYTYLGGYTAVVAPRATGLLPVLLLLVGLAGLAGALLAGRLTDARGPARSLRWVVGGHAAALVVAAVPGIGGTAGPALLAAVVAGWAFFAWALTPPVQGSILAVAGPSAGMTALALNISGLYLGTGVAGALGGLVIDAVGIRYVPVAAAVLMAASFALTLPTHSHDPAAANAGGAAVRPGVTRSRRSCGPSRAPTRRAAG